MADEKDTADNRSWADIGERAIRVGTDMANVARELATADVDTILRNLIDLLVPVQKSLEELENECSSQVDSHILDKERKENLKFAAGKFKIAWGGRKFRMSLELYYQDHEGKWEKEEGSTERSVRSLTEESRRQLEEQKERVREIEHP